MNARHRSTSLLYCYVLFLILAFISACTSTPTPAATPAISSEKAVEIAISGCKIPDLVLVGDPQNIQTMLLTLEEADQLTRVAGETTHYGIPMNTLVWLVRMDGQLQLVGGPAPVITQDGQIATPTTAQPFWGTCTVILDADSGKMISVRG